VPVWGLTGQDVVIAQLRRAIERDRVPHAYLFSGPRGAPLYDAAIALAMAVSCQRTKGDPCGECDACAKIIAGIHPDVTTLVREGAAQIVPIESVRTQVIARLGLPPHEGPVRVFIVEEATSLAPPAANALLKTLEEPPARTLFVMCTTAPEQLLPTIRSRCQRVRFAGGAAVTASDPERAARITALAEELASDQPDSSLPARIAEGKGDCAPVLEQDERDRAGETCRDAAQEEHLERWQILCDKFHEAVADHERGGRSEHGGDAARIGGIAH